MLYSYEITCLARALEWGSELRAIEGRGAESAPRQLSFYEGWNHQIFMESGLVEDLYAVQFW